MQVHEHEDIFFLTVGVVHQYNTLTIYSDLPPGRHITLVFKTNTSLPHSVVYSQITIATFNQWIITIIGGKKRDKVHLLVGYIIIMGIVILHFLICEFQLWCRKLWQLLDKFPTCRCAGSLIFWTCLPLSHYQLHHHSILCCT